MQRIAVTVLLVCVLACAGCSSGSAIGDVPPEAQDLEVELKTNMTRFMPQVPNIQSSFIFILNPDSPSSQGMSLQQDMTPGALPNSYTFSGPYDGNADSLLETQLEGSVTFGGDPASEWSGLNAQVSMDVNLPILGHVYHADIAVTVNVDGEQNVSGAGTFTAPLSGDVTSVAIASGSPLVIKAATGAADAVSNACGYSIDGQMQVEVESGDGTLSAVWNFLSDSPQVRIRNGTFRDAVGQFHEMPDSNITLQCGGAKTVNDWADTWLQNWACIPWENGQAELTLAVVDSDTVSITDEDPPGSPDSQTYQANLVSADARGLRGFFTAGVAPSMYREDFNWVLGEDGFSQSSIYTYTSGPKTGDKGMCVGSARKD
jgi:hypothetical protein